jgi:hypothetical protein
MLTCMSELRSTAERIREVGFARERLLALISGLTQEQATWKASPEEWSVLENLEHVTLAEITGIAKIWQAAEGVRSGKPVFSGDHTNRGLSIEEVVARTWKPREVAPPIATPHIGGTLAYWVSYSRACQRVLEDLGAVTEGVNLEDAVYPHFLSGPLDAGQRIDFLRFHLERHQRQIERTLQQRSAIAASAS